MRKLYCSCKLTESVGFCEQIVAPHESADDESKVEKSKILIKLIKLL
jgi:hypothetical protein